MKTCPQCNTENPDDVKFCGECGARLPAQAIASASGIAIGDKNTIAGDIVGHQELYRITGNATIVKNEDETKKVVKCHCCGRKLSIAESYECPHCGEATCQDCFDREFGACRSCRDREIGKRESAYREALMTALADGIVNSDERRELDSLRDKLGIDEDRAEELENEIRSNRPGMQTFADRSSPLTTFESIALKNAATAFYEELDSSKAERLIAPVYGQHDENEQVVGLYVAILTDRDSERAEELIGSLKVDLLDVKLALFDMHFRSGDMMAAEKALLDVERLWPDNLLVKTRRIVFSTRFAELTSDASFLDIARGLLETLGNPSGPMESSWAERAKHVVSVYGQFDEGSKTREQCKKEGLYWGIVSGCLSAPERTYRIEIRGPFGSVSPMTVPTAIKEEWEKSSENSFEEIVRQFVSGKMDEDDLPFSEMLPFEGGDLLSFDGRIGGLAIPDQDEIPWKGRSLTVVDDRGYSRTVKDDDLRRLVQAQENEPFPQLAEDRAALVIETKINVNERIIEIVSSEAIAPSRLGLRIHSVSVLNEQKRKQTIRIVDVVQWGERALEPEPSDGGENEIVSRVFWWSENDDLLSIQKTATLFLKNHSDIQQTIALWEKRLPDDLFILDSKFEDLMESETHSNNLFAAAKHGVAKAIALVAKSRYYYGLHDYRFSKLCECWKNLSYEEAFRPLALIGDPDGQFFLGWLLDQLGRRKDALNWYRDIVRSNQTSSPSILAYAKARCEVGEGSVEDISLLSKAARDVAEGNGVFAHLADLSWGFLAGIHLEAAKWKTLAKWEDSILETTRKKLVELDNGSKTLDHAIGEIELRLGWISNNPEMIRSAEKRGCPKAKEILPAVLLKKAAGIFNGDATDVFGRCPSVKEAAELVSQAESLGGNVDDVIRQWAIAMLSLEEVGSQLQWFRDACRAKNKIAARIVQVINGIDDPTQFRKMPVLASSSAKALENDLDVLEILFQSGVESSVVIALAEPLVKYMWKSNGYQGSDAIRFYRLLNGMVEKGDPTAMWYVAHFHQRGFGTEKSGKQAKELARKATEAGVADPFNPEDAISTDSAVQHVFRLFGKR